MHRPGTAFRRLIPASLLGLVVATYGKPLPMAADRFVAKTGSDTSNDCLTLASPCGSIAHALSAAGSGDTIKIATGKYRENNLTIGSSIVVTLSGGWVPGFGSRDPEANPTVIDAA